MATLTTIWKSEVGGFHGTKEEADCEDNLWLHYHRLNELLKREPVTVFPESYHWLRWITDHREEIVKILTEIVKKAQA